MPLVFWRAVAVPAILASPGCPRSRAAAAAPPASHSNQLTSVFWKRFGFLRRVLAQALDGRAFARTSTGELPQLFSGAATMTSWRTRSIGVGYSLLAMPFDSALFCGAQGPPACARAERAAVHIMCYGRQRERGALLLALPRLAPASVRGRAT